MSVAAARIVLVTGGDVVYPDRIGQGDTVVVRDGRIARTGPAATVLGSLLADVEPGGEQIDAHRVMPGLVDLHAHGARGELFNGAVPGAWRRVLDAHRAAGATALLATFASDTDSGLSR
jgi:N-acetylglucosamine-6-phosphate deacetylase